MSDNGPRGFNLTLCRELTKLKGELPHTTAQSVIREMFGGHVTIVGNGSENNGNAYNRTKSGCFKPPRLVP